MPYRKRFVRIADSNELVKYLFRDEFSSNVSAGSVNGTLAEPGPGTRTIVDPENKLSIGGGKLVFSGGATVPEYGNPGYWSSNPIVRQAGIMLFSRITLSSNGGLLLIGYDTDKIPAMPNMERIKIQGLLLRDSGNVTWFTGQNEDTDICMVLRAGGVYAFVRGMLSTNNKWILYYFSEFTPNDPLYPAIENYSDNNAYNPQFFRVPQFVWLPRPLVSDGFDPRIFASDSFNRANGPIGVSETGNVWSNPNGVWVIASNLTRNMPNLGSEMVINGGLEGIYSGGLAPNFMASGSPVLAESSDAYSGTKAQSFRGTTSSSYITQTVDGIVGSMYYLTGYGKRIAGTSGDVKLGVYDGLSRMNYTSGWTTATYQAKACNVRCRGTHMQVRPATSLATSGWDTVLVDGVSFREVPLIESFSSISTGKSDVVVSASVTLAATGVMGGVVVALDSTTDPKNFILAYHDAQKLYLEKCVNGVYSLLVETTASYSVGAEVRLAKSGTSVMAYYNGTLACAATVDDATIVNNTLHGLFSPAPGNNFDNFKIFDLPLLSTTDGKGNPEGNAGRIGAGGSGLAWSGASTWKSSPIGQRYNDTLLGATILTNGDFATDSSWSKGIGWSISGGNAVNNGTGGASSDLEQQNVLLANQWYRTKYVISVSGTTGYVSPVLGGRPYIGGRQTAGSYLAEMGLSLGTSFAMRAISGWNGTLDYAYCYPIDITTLLSAVESSSANVIIKGDITTSGANVIAGVVFNLDDAANPRNYRLAVVDGGGGGRVFLFDVVDGVYIEKASVVVAYVAGMPLIVVTEGTTCSVYYNGVLVSTVQTMTANTNRKHGLFAVNPSSTIDNFVVYPRGTDGEYSILDKWSK